MRDYPVSLRLSGRRVLVVGGGAIAEERVRGLLEAGARVTLVAPEVTASLRGLAGAGALAWLPRPFAAGDVATHSLLVACAGVRAANAAAVAEARSLGVLATAADDPELCDFFMPSVGRRGPITVAVSTGGHAPALAARLRRELLARVTPAHVWAARVSAVVRRRIPRGVRRTALLRALAAGGDRRALATAVRASLPGDELFPPEAT